MAYVANPAPVDPALFAAWVQQEFQSVSQALEQSRAFLLLDTLYAAPRKIREGLIVKADGTAWNPGSGAGVYCFRAGAWRFLG